MGLEQNKATDILKPSNNFSPPQKALLVIPLLRKLQESKLIEKKKIQTAVKIQ